MHAKKMTRQNLLDRCVIFQLSSFYKRKFIYFYTMYCIGILNASIFLPIEDLPGFQMQWLVIRDTGRYTMAFNEILSGVWITTGGYLCHINMKHSQHRSSQSSRWTRQRTAAKRTWPFSVMHFEREPMFVPLVARVRPVLFVQTRPGDDRNFAVVHLMFASWEAPTFWTWCSWMTQNGRIKFM